MTFLTDRQRAEYALQEKAKCIGDHIAMEMNRKNLNRTETALQLGLRRETLNKLLNGEEAHLSTKKWLVVLAFAGIRLQANRKSKLEEGAQ